MGGGWTNGNEDEVDDGIGEKSDAEAEQGVEDSILSVGDFLAVAAGNDIAKTAPDEHDDGNGANDVEGDVREASENAVDADELGGHAVSAGSFGAFLDGESHGFAGVKGGDGADPGDNL